jgi:hypothetical protein
MSVGGDYHDSARKHEDCKSRRPEQQFGAAVQNSPHPDDAVPKFRGHGDAIAHWRPASASGGAALPAPKSLAAFLAKLAGASRNRGRLHYVAVQTNWHEKSQMALAADQREALRMLAGSPHGCTESILLAHGFAVGMLRDLVRDGLATADRENVVTGRRRIAVTRLRITDAGRRALAGT